MPLHKSLKENIKPACFISYAIVESDGAERHQKGSDDSLDYRADAASAIHVLATIPKEVRVRLRCSFEHLAMVPSEALPDRFRNAFDGALADLTRFEPTPESARTHERVASIPYFPANIASALALTELPSALNPLYLSATLYALTNSSRDLPFFAAVCASLRKSL